MHRVSFAPKETKAFTPIDILYGVISLEVLKTLQ